MEISLSLDVAQSSNCPSPLSKIYHRWKKESLSLELLRTQRSFVTWAPFVGARPLIKMAALLLYTRAVVKDGKTTHQCTKRGPLRGGTATVCWPLIGREKAFPTPLLILPQVEKNTSRCSMQGSVQLSAEARIGLGKREEELGGGWRGKKCGRGPEDEVVRGGETLRSARELLLLSPSPPHWFLPKVIWLFGESVPGERGIVLSGGCISNVLPPPSINVYLCVCTTMNSSVAPLHLFFFY